LLIISPFISRLTSSHIKFTMPPKKTKPPSTASTDKPMTTKPKAPKPVTKSTVSAAAKKAKADKPAPMTFEAFSELATPLTVPIGNEGGDVHHLTLTAELKKFSTA